MSYYKLKLENTEVWKKYHDPFLGGDYYKKTLVSGTLPLKSLRGFKYNGMISTHKNILNDEYLRLRYYHNTIIIEPSGITLPGNSLTMCNKYEAENILDCPESFNVESFICNLISDFTRGGRDKISANEVNTLKENIIKSSNITTDKKSPLSPKDFMNMFILIGYQNDVLSFERGDMFEYIINNQNNKEFAPLISNIEMERYEHDDESPQLEYYLAILKYIGFLSPEYSKDNPYEYLKISPNALNLRFIYDKTHPEYYTMEKFMKSIIDYMIKKPHIRRKK